jgi:GT2 family glycosyltransferase
MNFTCAILSYNHPEITARCVRSVLRFTLASGSSSNSPVHKSSNSYELLKPDQIILVHNGSRSENVETLRQQFPQIQHLVMVENRGFSGGANAALLASFRQSDWCFFITNDTELIRLPEVNSQVLKKPAYIAPRIHFRRFGRIDSIGGQVFTSTGHLRHLKTAEEFFSIPKKEIYVPGTAFLIHKGIFESVGEFDEALHTYWEDVEYSLRVSEKNLPIQFTTEIELIHSVGKTCHKDPYYTSYLYHRNRARVCRQKTQWVQGYGLARAQLEFHLMYDYLKYSYRFAKKRRWDDVKSITRAYYGD